MYFILSYITFLILLLETYTEAESVVAVTRGAEATHSRTQARVAVAP